MCKYFLNRTLINGACNLEAKANYCDIRECNKLNFLHLQKKNNNDTMNYSY